VRLDLTSPAQTDQQHSDEAKSPNPNRLAFPDTPHNTTITHNTITHNTTTPAEFSFPLPSPSRMSLLVGKSRSSLSKAVTVVDVGANIGLFALYCLNHPTSVCRVVCIEPAPISFELLRHNVEVYGEDVILHQCAVGETAQSACRYNNMNLALRSAADTAHT
jgi:hypothetical protein